MPLIWSPIKLFFFLKLNCLSFFFLELLPTKLFLSLTYFLYFFLHLIFSTTWKVSFLCASILFPIMATETAASDHASTTHEQYVKKEKDEAIAQKIADLANEDEDKHDKPEDVQGKATPSSKTEEDEVKAKLASVEAEKSDDSPVLEASAEDSLKHDKVEDAKIPVAPLAEGDDEKAEPAVAVEKTEDSVPLDGSVAVADNLKEKELVPDSQTTSVTEPVHDAVKCEVDEPPPSESTVMETPHQVEKEPVETDEDKQSKAADIPEAPAETIEKASNSAHTNPLTESEVDVAKEAEVLETSTKEEEKPEPVATQVQEKTEEPEKEFKEVEQPSTVAIPEPSAEANEKPSDTIEEKTIEPSAEVLKETTNYEAAPTETVKAEPEVTEVEENQQEPEKQSLEQREEEKPDTSTIPELSAETGDPVEEKTREPEFEAEVLKETYDYEAEDTETEKAEPVVAKVDESQSKPEKQSFKQEEEDQSKTVVIPETTAEIAEQSGDIVEDHPPKDSDIEVVKETGTSESEAAPTKEEKPEPPSTEVEEKPREIQLGEEVTETSKEVETKQEIVPETVKSEETLDDTIKDAVLSSKEEKTEKEDETSLTVNAAQVSSNEEAQVAPANLVEPSPGVEEDGKKESSFTDMIEEGSNEAVDVIENPEQTSIDQEAKTGLKEEKEYSIPTGVEKKVAVAANDDKKPEAPDAAPGSSREVEVESIKVEEQNEAKTATTEAAESVKVESVKDDSSAVDEKKEGNTDTKVDEISTAVSEPIRETLASKFEEKEEESTETGVDKTEKEQNVEPEKTEVQATKESDVTKVSKDLPKETPVKPAQKQSNNIISKVKQSLVKAKKAITGKSPSSKNLSSEAKGDIKVK
ncbi:hypothetical protein VNO77_13765 [Canavalia gladiata]|uniref:Uncharacterized protein n=1 Tax=Canavalia gladiata TaxID=3824 RepID=A0AAN9LXL4_CANGL